MSKFDMAFEKTLGLEGGYTNDPEDSGGPTNWGITERTWLAYCAEKGLSPTPIKELTIAQAKEVYREFFWQPLGLDLVNNNGVACELFDTAVNCGLKEAALCAQEAVNLLCEGICEAVAVDGRLGPVTRAAMNRVAATYPTAFLNALNGFQFAYYVEVVKKYPKNRKFARGWIGQRIGFAMAA